VLLAEHDRDAVAELNELGLGERTMQVTPEHVVGAIRVPGNRLGPSERGALPLVIVVRIRGVGGDVSVAREIGAA
jgi:hypothetical protein